MNCKRAQTEIALWVGNDLDGAAVSGLRRHLARCGCCREHLRQMREVMGLLEDDPKDTDESLHDSVWPGLSAQLPRVAPVSRQDHFNGWIPAVAVAAICFLMVVVVGVEPQRSPRTPSWDSARAALPVMKPTENARRDDGWPAWPGGRVAPANEPDNEVWPHDLPFTLEDMNLPMERPAPVPVRHRARMILIHE